MTDAFSRFQMVPLDSVAEEARIDLLGRCFDRRINVDWYRWKYRDSPWGASRGVVGLDADGPAGVVHSIPWPLRVSATTMPVTRMLDSGTVDRVRRRGLFRAMVAHEVDGHRTRSDRLSFCTTTPNSTEALRGIGATVLEFPAAYTVGRLAVRPGSARLELVTAAEAVRHYHLAAVEAAAICTAWTPAALTWRFDPRSGHQYRGALLAEADGPTGLVYRVESRRGLRVILAVLKWGDPRGNEALIGTVARTERAPLVLDLARGHRLQWPRGRTVMCVWDLTPTPAGPQPTRAATWRLELAEAEGVM